MKPHAQSQRQLRIAEAIRRILAEYFFREGLSHLNKDSHTLPPVTITQVQISGDLQHAVVFVMPLKGENQELVIDELNKASRSLRGYLGKHLQARYTPTLKFVIDQSFTHVERIEALLQKMNERD